MIRPKPCVVCGATESAMTFASDPWCSATCWKQHARDKGYEWSDRAVDLRWMREELRG